MMRYVQAVSDKISTGEQDIKSIRKETKKKEEKKKGIFMYWKK